MAPPNVISEAILDGERVRLRPVREEDLPLFQRWLSDPDIYRWLFDMHGPVSWDDEVAWWERIRREEHELAWAIETTDGRLLGDVTLRWDPPNLSGDIGTFIGEKSEWDKGHGSAAARQVLAYAFGELGLNRVGLTCDATNGRAIRCYEKAGFRHEGVMRMHRVVEGGVRDSVVMGAVRAEFQVP